MRDKVLYGVISLLVIASLVLGFNFYRLNSKVNQIGTATTQIINFLNQVQQANQK